MLIPGEARLAPNPRITVDKGGTDKSVVCVKGENLSKTLGTLRGIIKITYLHTYIKKSFNFKKKMQNQNWKILIQNLTLKKNSECKICMDALINFEFMSLNRCVSLFAIQYIRM